MPNEDDENRPRDNAVKVTLYGPPQIPFTEKVRRALLYKRVAFEVVEPSSQEDYRRWNPETGLLPVIEVDDRFYPDSTAILFKLDEIFPDPPLLSRDPRVSGQQKQLEEWADENLLWYFNKWLRSQKQDDDPGSGNDPPSLLKRFPRLRRFVAWLRAGGTWERPEIAILRGVGDRLDDLLGFLGTRPFFYSNTVSMADLGVYSMLYSLGLGVIPGSQRLVTERTALVDFMRRVEAATEDPAESA